MRNLGFLASTYDPMASLDADTWSVLRNCLVKQIQLRSREADRPLLAGFACHPNALSECGWSDQCALLSCVDES